MAGQVRAEDLVDEDDPAAMARELVRMIQAGEVAPGAIRIRFGDGTYQDFAFGSEIEEEREQALALLQAQFATKH